MIWQKRICSAEETVNVVLLWVDYKGLFPCEIVFRYGHSLAQMSHAYFRQDLD